MSALGWTLIVLVLVGLLSSLVSLATENYERSPATPLSLGIGGMVSLGLLIWIVAEGV